MGGRWVSGEGERCVSRLFENVVIPLEKGCGGWAMGDDKWMIRMKVVDVVDWLQF